MALVAQGVSKMAQSGRVWCQKSLGRWTISGLALESQISI